MLVLFDKPIANRGVIRVGRRRPRSKAVWESLARFGLKCPSVLTEVMKSDQSGQSPDRVRLSAVEGCGERRRLIGPEQATRLK